MLMEQMQRFFLMYFIFSESGSRSYIFGYLRGVCFKRSQINTLKMEKYQGENI